MGLLRWLRGGDSSTPGVAATAAGLGALEGILNPAKQQQIENLQTLAVLRDDDAESAAPRRPVDLDTGTAVIRPPR
jgi:hypothetical protein